MYMFMSLIYIHIDITNKNNKHNPQPPMHLDGNRGTILESLFVVSSLPLRNSATQNPFSAFIRKFSTCLKIQEYHKPLII
jgi:hypothetical protein